MAISVDQAMPAASFVICLASFAWGMRRFFTQPTGCNRGMKLVSHVGTGTAILHFVALLHTPGVPVNRLAVGTLLYGCSLGLFWWAVRVNANKPLSAVFSRDLPVHLVTNGPYRLVRHPFYCSYLLTWSAGAVITAQPCLALTVLLVSAMYLNAVKLEERKFSNTPLSLPYQRYRSQTGCLLPNPFKLIGLGVHQIGRLRRETFQVPDCAAPMRALISSVRPSRVENGGSDAGTE